MMRCAARLALWCAWGLLACDSAHKETPSTSSGPSSAVALAIGGRRIDVTLYVTEQERRHVVPRLAAPTESGGSLLAWPRERYMKIESEGSRTGFDLVFLSASGEIVDLEPLRPRDEEGVVPRRPAAYVLLLAPGLSGTLGLKAGDRVPLPRELVSAKPEELAQMKINGVPAAVELALTDGERQHGLMFRPRMSEDDGMLFVYPDEGGRSFWMGNTLIPLDIAFFTADGTLLNVNETPTYPDPRHPGSDPATSPSKGDARFVLEMNLGWFRKKGLVDGSGHILPGTRAEIPPQALR